MSYLWNGLLAILFVVTLYKLYQEDAASANQIRTVFRIGVIAIAVVYLYKSFKNGTLTSGMRFKSAPMWQKAIAVLVCILAVCVIILTTISIFAILS